VAAAFHQSKLAAIVGPMALFVTILPRFLFFQNNRHEYVAARKWASLLPATAFCFGADIIADFEYNQVGIHSWNAGGEGYTFNTALGFLILDALLYFTLGWYLEQVLPRPVGKPRKPYFLFTISYWRDCFCFQNSRWDKPPQSMNDNSSTETEEGDSFQEVMDPSLKPRVRFQNIVKKYYRRRKDIPMAVNDLCLTLYEDQITALLGHNGAGKSTLIGILTGMVQPTSGDCMVDGYSIVSDTAKARRSIGYCPQENIIFPKMTVCEHIEFFMRIKGDRPTDEETARRASEVGLEEFLGTRAGLLSGGSQRKLCLAIAFCGDPHNSVLILDEPTSGMDPASRRACWNCLFEKRRGRCIVLVSHFMSEADLCGDRILIMKSGKLQASGSTMFLKNRFSLGYNLSVVVDPPAIRAMNRENASLADDDPTGEEPNSALYSPHTFTLARNQLFSLLQTRIPNIVLARSQGKEVTFRVPKGSEGQFPFLFEDIDLHKDELGIKAYGIENSSLEEVFLLLAEDNHTESSGIHSIRGGIASAFDEEDLTRFREQHSPIGGGAIIGAFEYPSWLQQVKLIFWKRYVVQQRDWKGAFFTILAPVLAIGLVLLILTVNLDISGPPLQMSPEEFGTSEIVVGGGASLMNQPQTVPNISIQIGRIKSVLSKEYGNLRYHQVNASSSNEMSNFLMSTYNDRAHADRFGAFVIDDLINATINIDWHYVQNNPNMIAALEDATGLAADPNDPVSGYRMQFYPIFRFPCLTWFSHQIISPAS
jgi:ABC-type multidrug transport system ATPase subunit